MNQSILYAGFLNSESCSESWSCLWYESWSRTVSKHFNKFRSTSSASAGHSSISLSKSESDSGRCSWSYCWSKEGIKTGSKNTNE